ncbi:hypothetical protein LAZ67_22000062 [Cordylochernes scorpioides]|uniref:SOCS box domain-containing protein n=1 Tax=Cordylochernes scorpioides TaxID=51811 RepID=A0ABY6LPV0_9ARAC|nr:hypothetical protein LAZ67_22000062 [Cordylochernes scorpioides]
MIFMIHVDIPMLNRHVLNLSSSVAGPSMPSVPCIQTQQRDLADSIIRWAPLDEIRILLACGARVNEPVTQGLRPLHYAVFQRYAEAASLLLVRGADPNLMDDVGYTALHLCAERGYIDLIRMLLRHKARVSFTVVGPEDSPEGNPPRATVADEPLRLSIKNGHYACAKFLLENGADPNAGYFLGSEINLISPLNLRFLELLLKFGADPNSRDRSGLTPLMKACRHAEGLEAAYLLISYGADTNAMSSERNDLKTPLHYSVISGNMDIVKLLVAYGAAVCYDSEYLRPTPLDFAVLRGNYEVVEFLIECGADVNIGSPVIGLPLHIALSEKIENKYEIVKLLLENGADPNGVMVGEDEIVILRPPLGEYINSQEMPTLEVVCLLLKHGARVVLKTQQQSPLGILNTLHKIHLGANLEVMDLLLQTCDEYSLQAVERSSQIPSEHKRFILNFLKNPIPLKYLTRRLIRKKMFALPNTLERIQQLPIPNYLKNFISYDYDY